MATAKPKEPFFATNPDNNDYFSKNIDSISNKRKVIKVVDRFAEIQLVRMLDKKQLDVLLVDKTDRY